MAAGTKVGTGFVEISPDFSGFQAEVERALRARMAKVGDRAGRGLSDGMSRRLRASAGGDGFGLKAALDPLLARVRKVGDQAGRELADRIGKGADRAKGDTFGLADAIHAVERRSGDAGRAAKSLERDMFGVGIAAKAAGRNILSTNTGLKAWHQSVGKNTRASRSFSDRLRAVGGGLGDMTRGLALSVRGGRRFQDFMTRANRATMFFRNTMRLLRWPAVITGVGLLTAGLASLAAGFFAAGASVGPLAGGLVALPALALTAASAFGALKLATAGIGDALKAAMGAQSKGGAQAVDTLRQQRDAADRVADAERTLADAHLASKDALDEAREARRAAVRELTDLKLAVEGTGDAEEAAQLQVRRLREELDELTSSDASELDIQFAENALSQAQTDLRQTRIDAQRTRKEYEKAATAGIEKMPQVVAATKAQEDADRAVEDAEREKARAVEASTVALATGGAAADAYAEKLGKLPASAQAFVKYIVGLKPKLDELRATAADNLFPGVTAGLDAALENFPVVNKLVGQTANALGGLAEKTGKKLGSDAWGRDLLLVGRQNTRTLNQMGDAGLNVADMFRHVLVAARPFVNWMGKGVKSLTGWMKTEAKAGRESGRLAAFFDRTKQTMQLLGPLLKGVGGSFLNIGKAARPLGNEILGALGKSAEGFRKWTGSMEGQNSLRKYFADAKPAIFEMGRLVRDMTGAFFRLGNQPGMASLIRQVRLDLLPALEDTVGTLSKNFGPAFVDALTAGTKLLQSLSHESGPLVIVVETLGGLAEALTWVIENIPGAKTLVTALLVLKGLSFASTILGIGKLGRQIRGLATVFGASGGVLGTALGSGISGGVATSVGGPGNGKTGLLATMRGKVLPFAKRAGLVGVGLALADGVIDEFGRRARERSSNLMESIQAQADGGKILGVDTGLLPGGLHEHEEAARKVIPLLERINGKRAILAQADIDEIAANAKKLKLSAAQRRHLERTIDLLRVGRDLDVKVELGMDPAKLAKFTGDLGRLRSGFYTSMGDIRKVVLRNMGIVRNVLGKDTKEGRRLAAENLRGFARAFRIEMQRSGDWTKAAMQRHRRLIERADIISPTRKKAQEFGREWAKGMENAKGVNRKGLREMIREAQKMPAPMRKVALETWMAQLREARRSNKIGKDEFRKYRSKVVAEFGLIETGSKQKSRGMRDGVTRNVEQLVDTTGKGFAILRDNTNAALGAYGVDMLNFKIKKFKAGDGEQKRQTGGFIVPGTGSGDTFHTAVKPGSFVLNRKATEAFGLQRGGLAPVALEPGERVFAPDEVKRVGVGRLAAANRAVQRFQTGGIVGIPWQPGEEVAASILPLLTRLHKKFGFTVTDAFDRDRSAGHKSPGHNLTGTAVDAAGGNLAGLVRWAVSKGLTTYWNGGAGATPLANHDDHAHIEFSGAGALLGAAMEKLARITLTGPAGPLRDTGQGALDKVRRAADRMLAKKAMFSGSGDPFSPFGGMTGGGNAAQNRALGKRMAAAYGWTGPQWTALDHLWGVDESGWDESVPNKAGSGAYGIAQALPASKYPPAGRPEAPNGPAKAKAQIAWGLDYIKDRPGYGDPIRADAFRHAMGWYQKGGLVGMVGDSLGDGTVRLGGLADKLKALGKGLRANVLGGRPSTGAAGMFNALGLGKAAQYVFDLGTNDTSVSALKANLQAVDRTTGDSPLHALTVLGAQAREKNAALKSVVGAKGLVDWASIGGPYVASDPMGLHPTGAGYSARAGLIAKSVKRAAAAIKQKTKQENAKKKAGKKPGSPDVVDISKTEIGSVSNAIKASMKLVRNPKTNSKTRSKQMRKLVARLKGAYELPQSMRDALESHETEEALATDRSSRADEQTFDVMDEDGEPQIDDNGRQVVSLGTMDGLNAAQWSERRLTNLLKWRNQLIEARAKVQELVDRMKVRIEAAQARIATLNKIVGARDRIKDAIGQLALLAPKPRVNRAKINAEFRTIGGANDVLVKHDAEKRGPLRRLSADLRAWVDSKKTGKIGEAGRDAAARWRASVGERTGQRQIISALNGRTTALTGDREAFEESLGTIQGPGYGMGLRDRFYGRPLLGQFSGSIFDAQRDFARYSELPPLIKKDADEPDHSRNLDRELFNQQYGIKALEELQKRISEGATRLVPFGGVFHQGGVVPGPVGQERMALVQSGEGVIPLDKMRDIKGIGNQPTEPPVLHADIYVDVDGQVIKKTVEVTLDERDRRDRGVMRMGVRP